jgi:hypothetical protein
MDQLGAGLLLTGLYPLYRAWRAVRQTTLRHAMLWALAAWLAWIVAWAVGGVGWRYFALSLAGCAGVAVLGARRPGAAAWNFAVAGLLLVLALPYLRGLGELRLEAANLGLLGVVLAVCVANYLPTRGGLAALLFGVSCGVELGVLGEAVKVEEGVMPLMLAVVPWLWLARLRRARGDSSEADRLWRAFRDAFGFLWAQRIRDQFNRAAGNAGLAVQMGRDGLRGDPAGGERALQLLRSVLRRFDARAPAGEEG